jgi:GNAT superfamily N-acetyltransferase
MKRIEVRETRAGDGEALTQVHAEMARYYLHLAPEYFQMPELQGFADELDAEVAARDDTTLHLVGEIEGRVVGTLFARLLLPEPGAARQISRDLSQTRLRIDYLAAAEPNRRQGVGARLVEAAEAWARSRGATVAETWTYHRSPLSVPFWEDRMGYQERSVNLRKSL